MGLGMSASRVRGPAFQISVLGFAVVTDLKDPQSPPSANAAPERAACSDKQC